MAYNIAEMVHDFVNNPLPSSMPRSNSLAPHGNRSAERAEQIFAKDQGLYGLAPYVVSIRLLTANNMFITQE